MSKDRLKDQSARDVITSELQTNVMVMAGAGAGKTHALIERMVAAVRTGAADVDRMAAITFTRKAAGEMRGRFFLRLRKEAKADLPDEEMANVQRSLQVIDQCFIGTIHSFCGRLLRERPLEAGLAPDFAELEERDESTLRREVWDRFVQERYADDDERLAELEEHGIAPEDLYFFFGRRCADSDLPMKETSTPRPDLLAHVCEVEAFINDISRSIPPRPDKLDKLMIAVRRARHFIDNHGVATNRDAAALLEMFEGGLKVTQKNWTDRHEAKDIQDVRAPAFQASTVDPALRLWREHAYQLVTGFVNEAVDYYDGFRQEEGKLTFQDLLIRASSLLQDAPDVRAFFQRRYPTILVDEFQDTDPIQAQILFYLTGSDVHERDWRKLKPRPGSLFLVGDDKQSIYRFRRADVEIFRFVANRIASNGGDVIHLNTSFRSLGNLCQWISASFPAIFSAEADPYQAPFQPLHEYRHTGIDRHCVRKISIQKIHKNKRDKIAEVDARRIAGFISAALRGETDLNHHGSDDGRVLGAEASPGDFLILTRTTGQLSVYARSLESAGIPFDIVGGCRLGDTAEAKALVTFLRAVLEPGNGLHFIAYLRGPLVGFSDADLYAIRRAGGHFTSTARIPDALDDALKQRLDDAIAHLDQAERDLTSQPPGAAIERIIERLGLLSLSAVHPDGGGSSRSGSLLRLLSLVHRHAARGWHWGRIVEDLCELIEERDYKIEEMTLEMGREDVVRIMNVHQSKGLEAPVVFLADPYDTSYEKDVSCHVSRRGDKAYVSMTITKPKGDWGRDVVAQPAGWEEDRQEEKRYEGAEEARLLYVAATRARNLLVVSTYGDQPQRGPWSSLYRHLAEIPELPHHEVRPRETGTDAAGQTVQDLTERAAERMREAASKTYSLRTVSGKNADQEFSPHAREGRGRDYGVVVHQLFEEAVNGDLPSDVEAYVRMLVTEAGLPVARSDDAIFALQRFKISTHWLEVQNSDAVFTEVPVGVHVGGGIVRGVIDLVYRTFAGWVIVDYKTDAARTDAELERLRLRYQPQVDAYVQYWSDVTGEPVVDHDLWFVHGPARENQLALF